MASSISGCGATHKKADEHISPYLRRRLRSQEEAQRERANSKTRLVRGKPHCKGMSTDPADDTSRDEQDDR